MPVKSTNAVINGITYILELGEDGLYHAIVPAPKAEDSDLVEYRGYPVTLMAEDTAGNVTVRDQDDPELGGDLRLVVKEDIFIAIKHWESQDYFNAVDYNRIKYNIGYIKRIADVICGSVEYENPGPDKSWEEYPKPEELQQMERNLNYICQASGLDPDQYGAHLANKPFLDYNELNHIEESCQKLFNRLYGMMKARKRFPFRMGKRGIF